MNLERFQHDSSMGLTLVMEKHGSHDQSTHGNWATGATMGEGVAASILERVRENGGLSVNMVDGSEPTSGYMVAKGSQYGSIATEADFYDANKGPKILADYMKRNRSDLATGKNYLGLWHNKADGQVYLDISENIQNVDTARTLGAKRDQISIWDVTNFAEIETGGTGSVGKTRGSETARHLEDDGRGNRPVRPATLGQIGKALKVIRFEAGLKPVLKHGTHTQTDHGNWARGVTGEEDALINEMEGRGPSLEDIGKVIDGPEQPGMQDLNDFVSNDASLYSQATDGIDERVDAALEDAKYEYEDQALRDKANADLRNRLYEKIQNEMIDEFIEADDGDIAQLWQEQNGGSGPEPYELLPFFEDVYNMTHDVIGRDGEVYTTLDSRVDEVYSNGGSVQLNGQIADSAGEYAGEFQRSFRRGRDADGNDIWVVDHDIFKMADEYSGVGFGSKFIAQQEAWYTATGFGRIDVSTAWDGARHWAKAGYDFDARATEDNIGALIVGMRSLQFDGDNFDIGSPARLEFDNLMSRMTTGYTQATSRSNEPTYSGIKNLTDENFPIPNDFAMIGYKDRVQVGENEITGRPIYTWAGAQLMAAQNGLNLKYQKGLTKEGRSIIQGPIDRDGDGMVFDGTPRERPASGGKLG